MIRHIVLLHFRRDVSSSTKQTLLDDLAGLQDHLQGVRGFHAGPNVSDETDLIRGFNDAFWFDFEDEKVRDAYLVDAEHQAVGVKIVAQTEGGVDGVIVVDMKL